jgi:hypothetical protein
MDKISELNDENSAVHNPKAATDRSISTRLRDASSIAQLPVPLLLLASVAPTDPPISALTSAKAMQICSQPQMAPRPLLVSSLFSSGYVYN